MTKKTIIALIPITILLVLIFVYQQRIQQSGGNTQNMIATSTPVVSAAAATGSSAISTTVSTTNHLDTKLYHNEEWGFEFWYPDGWEWRANIFSGAFSKFNLTVMKINGENTSQNDVLNIVTPDFVENAKRNFALLGASTSTVLVGNVIATEYRYVFEGMPSIDVDIPFGEYRILFGGDAVHEKEFHDMLSTFKFFYPIMP